MLKKILLVIVLLGTLTLFSQDTWKKTTLHEKDNVVFVASHMPSTYHLFSIDIEKIKLELQNVLNSEDISIRSASTILSFPNEQGELQKFKMLEASIMEDELAVKFPMIKTYIGQGIDDPTATLRMSIGTDGLHVMVLAADKTALMIDPYTKNRDKYIVYASGNLPALNEFTCGITDEITESSKSNDTLLLKNATDGKMREYRLAVACTIEYSAYHLTNQGVSAGASLAVKKAAVLSAIVNTVNRVTGIYERETGVKFTLVGNNSNIIFIDSDNFTYGNDFAIAGESQTVITAMIGSANYDIGHTFAKDGGGYAPGEVCSFNKAEAMTGHLNPIGDFFNVDYVSHEIGHQFTAYHSYNGGGGACSSLNAGTFAASEPGSGSTIMGYAGICAGINVQMSSDAYFHIKNLIQINNKVISTTCASITNTGNNEPTANAGSNLTIPNSTAFILEGQASDADGDTITYCWEQIDVQQAQHPLVSTSTQGPSYRSLLPSLSPNRFMPKFTTVYNGDLLLDNSPSIWEVTPTVGRIMNFRLTTRDNRADGGQSNSDATQITVSNVAGPFVVTSQTTTESWFTGETKTITWNVAGTNSNGINTSNVQILLVDGSGSELFELLASTPNNGTATITVPSIISSASRIMVKGVNNIFYAINSATFSVNSDTSCTNLCASTGSNTNNYDYIINSVVFNTINNTSSNLHNPYSDYSSISTNVVQNTSYDLTISQYTLGSDYPSSAVVWFDWNKDCVFNTSDEEYRFPNSINNTSPVTLNIPIPSNASLGNVSMRISLRNTNTSIYNAPCETGFIGETEDYTVVVTSTSSIDDLNNFDLFLITPNPNNGEFSIELKSDEIKDISVKVFDIIGRQIYNKKYANNQPLFSTNIKLASIQPGIYLVSISDGVRFNTKKIIIK